MLFDNIWPESDNFTLTARYVSENRCIVVSHWVLETISLRFEFFADCAVPEGLRYSGRATALVNSMELASTFVISDERHSSTLSLLEVSDFRDLGPEDVVFRNMTLTVVLIAESSM